VSVPSRHLQQPDVNSAKPASAQRSLHAAGDQRAAPPPPVAVASTEERRRWMTPARGFFAICALVIYLGWRLPTERYLTPDRGLGYILGIVGGSMMVILLLYSARKRIRWLRFLGPLSKWFEVHMALGVIGPILILFHSNFTLGATNSNVALFCMLTVAASGLVGRYFYSHIHYGLYGRKMNLEELQQNAERLRALQGAIAFLPELVNRLEKQEAKLLASGPRLPVFGLAKPVMVALNALLARWRLRRYISRALRVAARTSPIVAQQRRGLRRAANLYIHRRLVATRRVAEFEAYERLFSLWHVLHMPIMFIMFMAAIVHIVAVHVY
jgi:hypothetical protein